MYGIPDASGLEFLKGREVALVCYSLNTLIIDLGGRTNIVIEGPVQHRRDGAVLSEGVGCCSAGLASVIGIVGQTLTDFTIEEPKALTLKFSKGDTLTLQDQDGLESFVIMKEHGCIVV